MFTFIEQESTQVPVTIGESSFKLTLSPPSVEDRFADSGLLHEMFDADNPNRNKAYVARGLRRLDRVVGWEGVVDKKGDPIPFSTLAFRKVVGANPTILDQIGNALSAIYAGDVQQEKKSVAP